MFSADIWLIINWKTFPTILSTDWTSLNICESSTNRGYYMVTLRYELLFLSSTAGSISIRILSTREGKIRIPKRPCNALFILYMLMKKLLHKSYLSYIHFPNRKNSSIKEVSYRKMSVTKMLSNSDIKLGNHGLFFYFEDLIYYLNGLINKCLKTNGPYAW